MGEVMRGLEPKAKELGHCPGGAGTPEKSGGRVLSGPRKGPSGLRGEVEEEAGVTVQVGEDAA